MLRLIALVLICLTLQGCATITAVTIGTAVGLGVAAGVGRFAGERVARSSWQKHVAWKRCKHLRHDQWQLEQCVRYHYHHSY